MRFEFDKVEDFAERCHVFGVKDIGIKSQLSVVKEGELNIARGMVILTAIGISKEGMEIPMALVDQSIQKPITTQEEYAATQKELDVVVKAVIGELQDKSHSSSRLFFGRVLPAGV